jgi:hypothetical protein
MKLYSPRFLIYIKIRIKNCYCITLHGSVLQCQGFCGLACVITRPHPGFSSLQRSFYHSAEHLWCCSYSYIAMDINLSWCVWTMPAHMPALNHLFQHLLWALSWGTWYIQHKITLASHIGLEIWEYGCGDLLWWPRNTLCSQKLALTSPSSGGCSVGIVRSRTKATEFVCLASRNCSCPSVC